LQSDCGAIAERLQSDCRAIVKCCLKKYNQLQK
jgi:hypothetical protein